MGTVGEIEVDEDALEFEFDPEGRGTGECSAQMPSKILSLSLS